ncbi:postacrosomal sheath WW domain-binding protein, partial [Dromiciops gliroides]|uniref:postacrosomal sheath WW domain-binding protein n=1 Tax=Dromiciops gliroides TaxID=33562 RepID=UPI001CC5C06E
MAVNQHHTDDRRVIVPPGESILMRYEDVELSFSNVSDPSNLFKGSRKGVLFLTQYRVTNWGRPGPFPWAPLASLGSRAAAWASGRAGPVIFLASHPAKDSLMSFMMPFNLMRDYSVEQPTFGANYLKGSISAAPDGGWEGQATFKLIFRSGGAFEFGRLMTQCATNAAKGLPPPVMFLGFGPQAHLVLAVNHRAPPSGHTQVIYVMPNSSSYMPSPSGYQIAATSVPGYGVLPPGYVPPPPGYGPPPPGYGPPPPGYGPPPPGFVPPPPGYGPPPPGYGPPPPGFVPPPP